MGQLEGKVAIVTGSNRGIGRAIAVAYAREGAHVALVCRGKPDATKEDSLYLPTPLAKALLCNSPRAFQMNGRGGASTSIALLQDI